MDLGPIPSHILLVRPYHICLSNCTVYLDVKVLSKDTSACELQVPSIPFKFKILNRSGVRPPSSFHMTRFSYFFLCPPFFRINVRQKDVEQRLFELGDHHDDDGFNSPMQRVVCFKITNHHINLSYPDLFASGIILKIRLLWTAIFFLEQGSILG